MANRPTLSELRKEMDAALKETLYADLRTAGFKGSFPDFRRVLRGRTDVLHIQFEKYGGRFRIEIASVPNSDDPMRRLVKPPHPTVFDVPFDKRLCLKPRFSFFRWFPFVYARGQVSRCARQVQAQLPKAMAWWARQ